MAEAKTSARKKQRRSVPSGQLHIQATFNNTIVTFADKKGNVLATSSAGACGFRGSNYIAPHRVVCLAGFHHQAG